MEFQLYNKFGGQKQPKGAYLDFDVLDIEIAVERHSVAFRIYIWVIRLLSISSTRYQ